LISTRYSVGLCPAPPLRPGNWAPRHATAGATTAVKKNCDLYEARSNASKAAHSTNVALLATVETSNGEWHDW